MKNKLIALTLILTICVTACADSAEPAVSQASGSVTAATIRGRTSAPSDSRPAYVFAANEDTHRVSAHHAKKASSVSAAALERELESAYGFDINEDDFTDGEFNSFYRREGYDGLPGERGAYVNNIMSNVKRLFPAIPSDIVTYMDEAVNLTIIVSIDRGDGADGLYYAESNTIYLMYEGEAVVHEYGHMLHYALIGILGYDGFEREWIALNKGLPYNGGKGGSGVYDYETGGGAKNAVFYGDYATTDIYEDVAETFWLLVERPDDLNKLVAANAPLAQKAGLLDYLLRETLLETDTRTVGAAFEGYAANGGYGGGDEYGDDDYDDWDYGGDWYDEDWWCEDDYSEYDKNGDGYCDDCGEWLGYGEWGDEDYYYDEYDKNGDGYCDDCGEWLGY